MNSLRLTSIMHSGGLEQLSGMWGWVGLVVIVLFIHLCFFFSCSVNFGYVITFFKILEHES